jgi:hypothetical protein
MSKDEACGTRQGALCVPANVTSDAGRPSPKIAAFFKTQASAPPPEARSPPARPRATHSRPTDPTRTRHRTRCLVQPSPDGPTHPARPPTLSPALNSGRGITEGLSGAETNRIRPHGRRRTAQEPPSSTRRRRLPVCLPVFTNAFSALRKIPCGGAEGIRTPDLLIARNSPPRFAGSREISTKPALAWADTRHRCRCLPRGYSPSPAGSRQISGPFRGVSADLPKGTRRPPLAPSTRTHARGSARGTNGQVRRARRPELDSHTRKDSLRGQPHVGCRPTDPDDTRVVLEELITETGR